MSSYIIHLKNNFMSENNNYFKRFLKMGALYSAKQSLVFQLSKLDFEFIGRDVNGTLYQQKKTGLKIYMYK